MWNALTRLQALPACVTSFVGSGAAWAAGPNPLDVIDSGGTPAAAVRNGAIVAVGEPSPPVGRLITGGIDCTDKHSVR